MHKYFQSKIIYAMKNNLVSIITISIITMGLMMGCAEGPAIKLAEGATYPDPEKFEAEIDGKPVALYTLQNQKGVRVDITNFGGRIVSLFVPDKNGVFDDIVTGYHTIGEFVASGEMYFGALIGRFGNRIANGKFSIDGEEFTLATNNGPNHLHGGIKGFNNVVWDANQTSNQSLQLSYLSPHMEEGYPGNLEVEVTYELTDENELLIKYKATTDQKTVVNLTSHPFFNLAGEGNKTINNHFLKINANHYTPVDENLIPTGAIEPVEGTPFDFRTFRQIGERVESDHQQIVYGKGYDHNFVLNPPGSSSTLNFAAAVYDPESGRLMEIYTSEPGIQFYGGNFLTGNEVGKKGQPYLHRTSFCLETQHFPDSPNKPEFPSTILKPGQVYQSTTLHRFDIKRE
jgi:aldose 1-epimerase